MHRPPPTLPRRRWSLVPVLPLLSVLSATAAALVLLPGTAAADVTVAASRAEAGARDVTITFRVTNTEPGIPTTRLQVFLPTVRPLLGVRPTAPTGWTAQVATAPPAAPLTVDGVPVPLITTAVTWTGGAVPDGRYAVFPLDVDRLPDGAGPLRFRAVATAASGVTEEWSDLVPYGAPAPAHPALVVPYSVPPPGVPPPGVLPPGVVPTGGASPEPAVAHHHHGDGDGDVTLPAGRGGAAATAWLVALAGLAAGSVTAAAAVLGRRQRRLLGEVGDSRGSRDPGVLSRRGRRP